MKDTIITSKQKIKEIKIFLTSLVIAYGINVYAIITHKAKWTELYSTFHIVLAVAVCFYVFIGMIRLLWFGMKKILKK